LAAKNRPDETSTFEAPLEETLEADGPPMLGLVPFLEPVGTPEAWAVTRVGTGTVGLTGVVYKLPVAYEGVRVVVKLLVEMIEVELTLADEDELVVEEELVVLVVEEEVVVLAPEEEVVVLAAALVVAEGAALVVAALALAELPPGTVISKGMEYWYCPVWSTTSLRPYLFPGGIVLLS